MSNIFLIWQRPLQGFQNKKSTHFFLFIGDELWYLLYHIPLVNVSLPRRLPDLDGDGTYDLVAACAVTLPSEVNDQVEQGFLTFSSRLMFLNLLGSKSWSKKIWFAEIIFSTHYKTILLNISNYRFNFVPYTFILTNFKFQLTKT